MLLPDCLVQDAWKHSMINIKNQMNHMCIPHWSCNVRLQIILSIQTSSKILPPTKNGNSPDITPDWCFRLMARYTWALYPSPATTALELTCRNFSDYLAEMVKIILRVGARKNLHTKTLCCLKSRLPLFGEASLNQMDGCFQQSYMHTVTSLCTYDCCLSWLRWGGSTSEELTFPPSVSTYLWHHGPRNGRPPLSKYTVYI